MAYRVLARTYRSTGFDDIVGQEGIATTLTNAVASGRIHHGYLFTGTRGVGKTSTARVLAKALNCLASEAPTVHPCLKCESCRAIAEGEDVDVVEIDAASNTGVDNIRDLRNNAAFRPARSRFKIYIIDEVHMLSTGAFNALLKTLEEPPEHVKFILATTEPEKVPLTIQSRCQRFDFRAIDADRIAAHLGDILTKEGIEADDAVIRRVARLANGSMRDALSLLDKLLSYGAGRITSEIAEEVMPPPHDELAAAVIDAVAARDAGAALASLDRALQSGRTVDRFCDHLVEHLRTLMLLNVCGPETELVDVSGPMRPALVEQSRGFDAPTYVYMIALLEELRRAVRYSGAARALADATVVRLAMSHQFSSLSELLESLDGETNASTGSKATASGPAAASSSGPSTAAKKKEPDRLAPRASLLNEASAQRGAVPGAADPSPELLSQESQARRHRSVSPELWERAARDPFVQRVREAVQGTLMDIRPVPRVGDGVVARAEEVEETALEEGNTESA
ncbi:MAG: DNA polymerase III subunit gamma/tau [Phycisphaerae bacterium]|nr:DNA polymerase III subunit gamma/tau [Phycisphaerae bacterium]